MLCPNCGADVGDELKLCPNCRFEPTVASSSRNAATSGRHIIADEVEEFDTSPPSVAEAIRNGKGPLNFLIRYVFPAIAGLLASVAFMTFYGPRAIKLTQPEKPPELQLSPSRAIFGTEALKFDSVILYNDKTSVLNVGFYRSLPASFNRELLSSVPSLAEVRGERPDILLTIRFSGESGCDSGKFDSAVLTINAAPKGFPLAQPQVSLVAVGVGAAEAGANALTPGLSELRCSTKGGGTAQGSFAASPRLVFTNESEVATLDLTFRGPLIHTSVADELFYRSANAQDTVALLLPKKHTISIGYFSEPLPVSASEQMRTAQSLLAVADKRPEAVVSLAYEPGISKLSLDKIKSYSLTFYRNGKANESLPSSEESATVAFLGVPADQLAHSKLQGQLGEGLVISGALNGSSSKQIEGKAFKLGWSFDILAPLLDVNEASLGSSTEGSAAPQPTPQTEAVATPAPASTPSNASAPNPSPSPVAQEEFFGDTPAAAQSASLTFDGSKLAFRTIVPIYYEDTGDLALGFYVDELAPADVKEIQRRRVLQGSVRNLRPTMVIILDFRAGTTKVDDKALVGYTIYFYRDAAGQLSFGGVHDSISFKRLAEKFSATDLFNAAGTLAKGKSVELKLSGTSENEKSPASFAWAIDTSIPIP